MKVTDRHWCIESYLYKLYPDRIDGISDQFCHSSRQVVTELEVTDELLYESYIIMATIVKLYGDQYLPIFERLKSEIDMRDKRRALLDHALALAETNNHFRPE